jgi:NitT/TauT family transport system ATP-binding protein
MTGSLYPISAGFMPLLDSVLLVLARERGFAAAEGLDLTLVRETSWANIRDRVGVGHFEVAQMLAPMPIAAVLGLSPLAVPFIAPMVLGLGGNAVTVGPALWAAMAEAGAPAGLDASAAGAALAKIVRAGGRKLRFGVVHQISAHNYELRYWLAASGIMPDRDVEIIVLPPALLPDALGAGGIDGYCVGEPWNSVGVALQGAHIVTVKASIWQSSPDKVLGLRQQWADDHPDLVAALIRALHRAALWCADGANHAEIAAILAAPVYLAQPAALISQALSGRLAIGGGEESQVPDFYLPHARAANFPWKTDALWFYSQMVRWGEIAASPENAARAAASFRPDLYRAALRPLAAPVPRIDDKPLAAAQGPVTLDTENGPLPIGPAGFFDGHVFDPSHLDDYIASQRDKV